MDWQALRRIFSALLVLIVSLILVSQGASWAAAIALVALVAMLLFGLAAKWPWQT